MTADERQKRVEDLIMEALRTAIEEKLISYEDEPPVVMVADWAMVVDTVDEEGEPGTSVLHPFDQRHPEAYKLFSIGMLSSEESIRAWLRGE